MKYRPLNRTLFLGKAAALLLAAWAACPNAHAISGTWAGTGTNGNWNTTGNWTSGTAAGNTGTTNNTDTATFNATGLSQMGVVIDSGRNLRSILFDGSAGSYTFSGSALNLSTTGTIGMQSGIAGTGLTQTFNNNLILNATNTTSNGTAFFLNNSADATNTIKIGGNISGGNTTGVVTLTLGGTNLGNNEISGSISNGSATAVNVTKSGTGTWTLSGSNSYSGTTSLGASVGRLNINNANALGTSVFAIAGGTTAIDNTSASAITLAGISSIAMTDGSGGNQTVFLGTKDLNLGTAALTISAAGNYTRSINVSAGGTLTIGGNITAGGTGQLAKDGEGVLVLSGTNSGMTRQLRVNAGVLRLGSSGTTSLGGGNTSLLGGVLELTAASGDLTALAWGAGAGQINLNGGGFSAYDADRTVSFTTTGTWGAGSGFSGSSLTLSSVAAGAKITFASDINLNTGAGSSRTITVNNGSADADAEISGVLSGGQANSTLIKSGAGTLVLSTTNTYTGTTSVQAGVLRLGANNVFADTSKMLVDGGVLDINSRTDTVSSVTLKSGLIAGTTGTLTSTSTFAVESGTISSRLGGSVGLTKSTSGTATLSGGNVYTGATTVSAGTLLVSSAGSLASSGVTVDGGAQFVYNNNTTGYTGNVTVNGALGGSGRLLGTISGTGQVGPGNSPGILTAAAVNPAGGLDFAFEFTATGSPNYGNNTASVNDVLRLTDATTPFTASLNSSNTIKIYLNVGSLTSGDIFYGGFYADQGVSFLGSISAATYEYYLFNASGAFTYNGTNYDLYTGPFTVDVNTVAQTANFTGADINGYVTEFTVVPEPHSISMLLAGAALTIVLALRRRRA